MSRLATRQYDPFGSVIRERRVARAIDQRALAARIGISPTYLCDIERGYRRPSAWVLDDLIAELGIARRYAHYLLGEIPPDVYAVRLVGDADEATVLDAWVAFVARLNGVAP